MYLHGLKFIKYDQKYYTPWCFDFHLDLNLYCIKGALADGRCLF